MSITLLNRSLFEWVFQISRVHTVVEYIIVLAAVYLPYAVSLWVLYYVAAEREWRRRLFFFLELLLSLIVSRGIVTEAIRFFFPHPRPFDALDITALVGESGDSFPSGHGAFFFALAGTVWFYNRRRGALLFFLALVIGIARVAAGVHWPLDIVGGIATGILSALIVHFLFRRDFKKLFSASR